MALGGFFGAFANIIGGLATASIQRGDTEHIKADTGAKRTWQHTY